MIKTLEIQKAIRFATKTHEVYQKQKRKGKDIPYITHPLTVGLILAKVGASEEVVIAGILHDTIEDSIDSKKVTSEMIEERFGKRVMELVLSVTEKDKNKPWVERKEEAIEDIKKFDHDSLLVKSADVVANLNEVVEDYNLDGGKIFNRFYASKKAFLEHQLKVIETVVSKWNENPLRDDLLCLAGKLEKMKDN